MGHDKLRLLMKFVVEYKDLHLTFDELLHKDSSLTIHHGNLQKLATEMYKIHHNLSPSIMKATFPERSMPYNLRNNIPFQSTNVNAAYYGTETLSFRGPKTWALVLEGINYSKTLVEFMAKIRTWKPIGCTCRLCKIYIANLGFL